MANLSSVIWQILGLRINRSEKIGGGRSLVPESPAGPDKMLNTLKSPIVRGQMGAVSNQPAGISFGRVQVLPHRRELVADGRPVKLGGRAYDVLMVLIEARGAVVSKGELMARVWPDRVVEENALQAQI